MKILKNAILSTLIIAPISLAQAETFTYKADNFFNSSIGSFPSLELDRPVSAVLKTENNQFGETQISHFSLDFENAKSLRIGNLKKATDPVYLPSCTPENTFVGSANSQWYFRAVNVFVCFNPIGDYEERINFTYQLEVKTYDSWSSSQSPGEPGLFLASGEGEAFNSTFNKVIDTYNTKLEGKTLRLRLLKRPGTVAGEFGSADSGFKIEALWMGNGEKTLVFRDAPIQPNIVAVGFNVETVEFSETEKVEMISIRYEDEFGAVSQTPEVDLRMLVESGFGPIPAP